MPNQTPIPTQIPTQINIAPSGMTWKNWKLVHGTDGFPTRETMEKYLCNPDRVRDLEECRDLNLQTIKQLEALIQLYEAQMEAVGAGGVEPLRKCNKLHQIAEPAAPVGKPIEDAIDALVMAAFTEGGCSEHRMSEARIQTELRKKELRTEIARLTYALARAEAQLAAAPQAAQGMDAGKLLAEKHTGMMVDYRGLLGQVQREIERSAPGHAEMLRQLQGHLQELGQRWYAGDTAVVDELLQLYCVERQARADLAAQAKQGGVEHG